MYKGSVVRKMCCAIYVLYGVILEKHGAILGSYSVHTKNKKLVCVHVSSDDLFFIYY